MFQQFNWISQSKIKKFDIIDDNENKTQLIPIANLMLKFLSEQQIGPSLKNQYNVIWQLMEDNSWISILERQVHYENWKEDTQFHSLQLKVIEFFKSILDSYGSLQGLAKDDDKIKNLELLKRYI